ncbi:MAG: hypothetical protein FJX77_06010 [Armatimonadetes bacterium]|nr:hypothetical protein [Armatimonadota bacterium]
MPPAGRVVTLAMLQRPTDTILIGEQTNAHSSEIRIGSAISPARPAPANSVQGLVFAGHQGGFHLVFADGHARWRKPTATGRRGNNMWAMSAHELPALVQLRDRLRAVDECNR